MIQAIALLVIGVACFRLGMLWRQDHPLEEITFTPDRKWRQDARRGIDVIDSSVPEGSDYRPELDGPFPIRRGIYDQDRED